MKLAVVGASGIVGRAVVTQAQMHGIEVVAISRHQPDIAHCEFVPLDLLDLSQCHSASESLSDATHVVYTALFEKPGLLEGWRSEEQMQTNLTMLRNCLEIALGDSRLEHVALLQGTKAYAAHIQPMRIPGKVRTASRARELLLVTRRIRFGSTRDVKPLFHMASASRDWPRVLQRPGCTDEYVIGDRRLYSVLSVRRCPVWLPRRP